MYEGSLELILVFQGKVPSLSALGRLDYITHPNGQFEKRITVENREICSDVAVVGKTGKGLNNSSQPLPLLLTVSRDPD